MGVRTIATVSLLVALPLFGAAGLGSPLPPEACFGASEEDLERGFVVVSGDGLAPDDLLVVDEDYTVWTPEQYLCVYPPPVETPSSGEPVANCLRDDVLANVTATPEEQAMLCSPVAIEAAELPETSPPASSSPEAAEATTASAGVGSGWRHMGSSIALKVNVVSPVSGNVPGDKCHWTHMEDGTNSLEGDLFGHRINHYCYLFTYSTASSNKNPDGSWRAWDPCFNPWGSYGCTSETGPLADRLRWHVSNKIWSKDCGTCQPRYFLADQVSEVTLAWIWEGTHNGEVDLVNGWTGIISERTKDGDYNDDPDWNPESVIVKHELAHLLSGTHFPAQDWRLYVCNWPHWHGWYDHWHSTKSVMNYCWAGLHDYMGWEADPNGRQTIRDNAGDWTSCSTSGALRPYPGTCL